LSSGRDIRWFRLFRKETNRSVIIALDHGLYMGPIEGIKNVEQVLKGVIEGGADAVIVTPGILKKWSRVLAGSNLGIILRVDHLGMFHKFKQSKLCPHLICGIEEAVALGADGVIASYYVGLDDEFLSMKLVSEVVRGCRRYGLVSVIELSILERNLSKEEYAETVSKVSRVLSELGADLLKIPYTGDPETFRDLVTSCLSPVVVLGGPRRESLRDFLKDIEEAVSSGAVGVAVGRNVWQHKNFEKIIEVLVKIVHEGISLNDVVNTIGSIT